MSVISYHLMNIYSVLGTNEVLSHTLSHCHKHSAQWRVVFPTWYIDENGAAWRTQ